MLGYRVPNPDQALLISGGHKRSGAPFQVVTGHGKFIGPFRRARFLTLALQESVVSEECVTTQGIAVGVRAVIAFKVAPDEESIVNAGQRFLSESNSMAELVGRIFAGHLRSVVGAMTVEEIVTQRQKLAGEVLEASKIEMSKLGLLVDSFQIQQVDDRGSGYIEQMSAPHRAAIERQAKIAQAQATQAAVQAEQEAQRQQLQYQRDTAIAQQDNEAQVAEAQQGTERKKVGFAQQTEVAKASALQQVQTAQAKAKEQVDAANSRAAQAGPLAQAQASLAVTQAQKQLAAEQVALREQQLQAEVVKPAQADAEKRRISAQAEADAQQLLNAAQASNDKIQLEALLVQNAPQIVQAAASALQGANVTVVNGTDGVNDMLTGVATQGLAIVNALKNALSNGNVSDDQLRQLSGQK